MIVGAEAVNEPALLAIHDSPTGFHPRWVAYCQQNDLPFKRVDCYRSDIVDQLQGCRALFWHHSHSEPRDVLIAQKLLFACEHAGFSVFPDFRTSWHFDDKVAQKYLFELLDLPAVPAKVFVDRRRALDWIEQAEFPKVFKLRRGAGSAGVRLVRDRRTARGLVNQAFGRGFPLYDPWASLKERADKVRIGKLPARSLLKGLARLAYPPRYARVLSRERGYVYFQDYIPENDSDIRVIVIGDRAFGIRRMVRPGDFRASGSGRILHARQEIDERCVELAFRAADKLGGDCAALDFVFDRADRPLILEISYGFDQKGYESCPGYWNRSLSWHSGRIDPQGWMIAALLKRDQS
jgi:glutathione synthase/RimK-type ligase-like ATP-grasp enzyme